MAWAPAYSAEGELLYWNFDSEIQKPKTDATHYRLIRLRNDIQALLCSDSEATSSGISILVPAGAYDQPVRAMFCKCFNAPIN